MQYGLTPQNSHDGLKALMSAEEILLLGIIAGMLVAMFSNQFAPDLIALSTMLMLGITGLVDEANLFSGFSSSVVITLMGLFIITSAIEDSGLAAWIAPYLERLTNGSERRLIFVIMFTGALMSLVMNNIAAGAVLLPMAIHVSATSEVKPSRLLIPLSFGTLVGGMATYFTSANIILSDLLKQNGEPGLGMMDFLPVGGVIIGGTLAYMLLVGRYQLPFRNFLAETLIDENLYSTYQLGERLWELEVPATSDFAYETLNSTQIGQSLGLTVIGIKHDTRLVAPPSANTVLRPGAHLWVVGRDERVENLIEHGLVEHTPKPLVYNQPLTEVIIPPRSSVISKTLKDLHLRERYGVSVLALWREANSYRTDVGDFQLKVGDALLMQGDSQHLDPKDFLFFHNQNVVSPRKMITTVLVTIIVLGVAIFNLLPVPETMLAGGLVLVLSGNMTMYDVYRAIEWRVLFLIAGLLPLSIAMTNTGFAAHLGKLIVDYSDASGPLAMIMGLFLVTVVVTQIIGGQVAAIVVGPIAIAAALQTGTDPQATAVAVAVGCSSAFLSPIAHPVNMLVMGPGSYTFGDFFRIGIGMLITTFFCLLAGLIVFY